MFSLAFSVLDISQMTFPSSVTVLRTEIFSFFEFTFGSLKKTKNFSAQHCHLRWEKSFGKCLAQKTQQKTTLAFLPDHVQILRKTGPKNIHCWYLMKFMAKNRVEKKVPPIFTFWVVSYMPCQFDNNVKKKSRNLSADVAAMK